jgi:Kinesin motor domain
MSTAGSEAAAAMPAAENSAAAAGGACAATVKVAVRVRPLIGIETSAGCQPCLCGDSENNQIVVGDDRIFQVDYAFGSESTQEEVYVATVRPLVQRSLEGYNSCVFAYGQSGSGNCCTSYLQLYDPFGYSAAIMYVPSHVAWGAYLTPSNVCSIVAGKTFSMGNAFDVAAGSQSEGIIPRAVADIFQRVRELEAVGTKATVAVRQAAAR